ncbi:MAG: putative nucleic acid-binding Zn-ribbon protein [Bacteroidia bacterium]|jgi:predicted  nucleic acid-binding Zn-ribbon protein
MATKKATAGSDFTVEEKLKALHNLQTIDSEIDRIRTIRGELPLEVQDLDDDIVGLETRLQNLTDEVNAFEDAIVQRKNMITDALTAIKKYETQQGKVRNNREFDSINKEIEYQNLEIQLCEKKMNEFKANIEAKNELTEGARHNLEERQKDLEAKKAELDSIIAETEKDEAKLSKQSRSAEKVIEERLITAYKRIRENSLNGLAVVKIERSACGGCFNKIPPQRILDISLRKKIIVCEHCGRVLVDPEIDGKEEA